MNRSIRALALAGWAVSLACVVALAGEAAAAVGKPKVAPKAATPVSPLAQKAAQARFKQQLELAQKYQLTKFTRRNSAADILTGFVTYSRPTHPGGKKHTAYIFLVWGDLENKIKGVSSKYYSNWDGYVKAAKGTTVSVVREFAFDDGTPRLLTDKQKKNLIAEARKAMADQRKKVVESLSKFRDAAIALARKLIRDPSKLREAERNIARRYHEALRAYDKAMRDRLAGLSDWGKPGPGSGFDELVEDKSKSQVTWEAGVVGATDGLLVRLDMQTSTTAGEIKAGRHIIRYRVSPLPAAKQASIDAAEVWKRTKPAGKPLVRPRPAPRR